MKHGANKTQTMKHAARAGFTLIELLVALAIFALLGALGYRGMASLADSEARLTVEAERWRTLDQLFARLEADVRATVPRPMRNGRAVLPPWQGGADAAGNAELSLARAGPEFTLDDRSAGQRIGYRLHDDAIEVLYWPYFDMPDGAAPATYVLAAGIARFSVRYLDAHDRWQ